LIRYRTVVNIVCGLVVVFFGLNFLGVFRINLFKGIRSSAANDRLNFFSAILFGIVFSLGWTPCVGAFLGSALMLASQQGSLLTGILMLLCYSLGLGIPFLLSAVLIDRLKDTFSFLKRNYRTVNLICGILLVLVGVLMISGIMGRFLAILS